VFLFVSPKRGLIYGITAVVASMAVLLAITAFYPAYISLSLIDNANSSAFYNVDHMRRQTLDWLLYSLPLTVGLVVRLGRAVINGSLMRITQVRPSPFGFASAVNAAVFFAVFAGHAGAHMTYLFHLVTPLLIVALLPRLGEQPWGRARRCCLPIAFVANWLLSAHLQPVPGLGSRLRSCRTPSDPRTHVPDRPRSPDRWLFQASRSLTLSLAILRHRRDRTAMARVMPGDMIRARWDGFLDEITSDIIGGDSI
jgi:hypothetical protein